MNSSNKNSSTVAASLLISSNLFLEACPFLYVWPYCRVCLLSSVLLCIMPMLYDDSDSCSHVAPISDCNSGRSKGKVESNPGTVFNDFQWPFVSLATPGSFCRFAGCSSCMRRGTGLWQYGGAEDAKMYLMPLSAFCFTPTIQYQYKNILRKAKPTKVQPCSPSFDISVLSLCSFTNTENNIIKWYKVACFEVKFYSYYLARTRLDDLDLFHLLLCISHHFWWPDVLPSVKRSRF